MIQQVIHGEALEELRKLPDNSVDAICCDPPAGISFMGMAFDSDRGGRDKWVAWLAEIMSEALRVLKPGGHALVWSLPRTSHWTAYALENAGFEIRDSIEHVFGSGFPKSLDVSKAIDKHLKAEREVVGTNHKYNKVMRFSGQNERPYQQGSDYIDIPVTAPATPEAEQWSGFGSALKPAHETWWLCRKPLAEKSIAAQVLATGTGAINIDKCRVGTQDDLIRPAIERHNNNVLGKGLGVGTQVQPSGRWPANILFSHSIFCTQDGTKRVRVNDKAHERHNSARIDRHVYGDYGDSVTHGYADDEGYETVEAWICDPSCPVRLLDEQSGNRKSGGGDKGNKHSKGIWGNAGSFTHEYERSEGGASRFFYCPKPSRSERTSNGTVNNTHPTLKSINLMKYLITMITPPGGVVLDCFAGSGTTALACIQEGFGYILIERELEYIDIINARINHAMEEAA